MGQARPKATVVVLNYNGRSHLESCFRALLAQELADDFELLMVDNGSTDGSVAYMRENFTDVRVLALTNNLGFSGGNNRAIGEARGQYVVLLNNDTEAQPGWLAALVDAAESDPTIAAVTSKLVFHDRPNVIQNAGSLLLSDGSGADRGFNEPDTRQYELREEVFAACGAAVLLNRRALEDVGLLDETFFAYYEDTDLSWRLRLRGWRIVYEPRAVVRHVHAGTSVEWSAFFTFHSFRNRLFMIMKNAPAGFVVRTYTNFALLGGMAVARVVLRRGPRELKSGSDIHEMKRQSRDHLRTYVKVFVSLLAHTPGMLAKRWRIRRRRRVDDTEIWRWLFPREKWEAR